MQESPGENHVCFPVKIFPNQSIDIPKVWIFTNSIIGVSMDSQYERGVFPSIVAFPIKPQHSALTTAGSFSTRHLPDYSNNISLVLSLLILQKQEQIIWLVIWNTFYFSIYWDCHHPNWRTQIFQRGRSTTNHLFLFKLDPGGQPHSRIGRMRSWRSAQRTTDGFGVWPLKSGDATNKQIWFNGDWMVIWLTTNSYLVGGFKHFLFSIIYGIILPIDLHIFQDG